jgi:hypothetical protein
MSRLLAEARASGLGRAEIGAILGGNAEKLFCNPG